jgi:hypothetical protein
LKAIIPQFDFGIPTTWVTPFDCEYYNGRLRDVNGNLVHCSWQEGDFDGKAIDPKDPPRFEGEATYLARLKLLLKGEEAFIAGKSRQPEKIEIEMEE